MARKHAMQEGRHGILRAWSKPEPVITDVPHEGPNVFALGGWYWMIVDEWRGLAVHRSKDLKNWTRQGLILDTPGTGPDDSAIGQHPDVVVDLQSLWSLLDPATQQWFKDLPVQRLCPELLPLPGAGLRTNRCPRTRTIPAHRRCHAGARASPRGKEGEAPPAALKGLRLFDSVMTNIISRSCGCPGVSCLVTDRPP
ncbi:MAG TPA: hypothetical protein VJ617_05160 [Arthrobacter sp.]|nr:hypothetical protein [Arthrobacter sp.]